MVAKDISPNLLKLVRIGIDARNEYMVFMRKDCPVCISEGFEALNRIIVAKGNKTIVASLIVWDEETHLKHDQLGLSEAAIDALEAKEGELLRLSHLDAMSSMSYVRKKIYGHRLNLGEFDTIVKDIVNRNLSNLQLSAFLASCTGDSLDKEEVIALTKSMINIGYKLEWDELNIYDKHCIGGLPGNRTTPIVVAIVAAAGLIIPKTSSRAITSPAGTADTMEVMTNVNLTIAQMKKVVKQEGGCLAWGGSVQLSPADDILIRVEKALDIDSEGQMIASVLSKKAAAGSTDVVIDIPVGPTAKVRSQLAAEHLSEKMIAVGKAIGLNIEIVLSDGFQPVGRGIGPSLEAKDVLAVLRNEKNAPADLRERAVILAGELLEMAGMAVVGTGEFKALKIIRNGTAYDKFLAICKAQGHFKEPGIATLKHPVYSNQKGRVFEIDNRRLAKVAKLAGAPSVKTAGVLLYISLGSAVKKNDIIFEIHAESKGELEYALSYLNTQKEIIKIKES
ncbi:thymidine phosphorylase family protein [uncultured Cyclobacterium sp.]|uniref:thymidine phosphorylase family protein n=1 Tax=uncultured Cyclobacterium sp. TaxID=453820 RepID=UPI0030EBCA7B